MPQKQHRSEEWETPTEWLWRALRLPAGPLRLVNRYRLPPADLMDQRRLWVMELPTLILGLLSVLLLPLFALSRSPFTDTWLITATVSTVNYVLLVRGRSRVVVTLTLLIATWLPVTNPAHLDGDVVPLAFMGGVFALLGAALLQPARSTLFYGVMAELALHVTERLHGTSELQSTLAFGLILLTSVAAAGSWATHSAFDRLERALESNRELGERLKGINATLEATNVELEDRVAQRTRELEEISVRDELTRLYNRRYYTLEMTARQQEQRLCTILMADVDHFKTVNDTLGHAVGDVVLRRVSAVLRRHVRGHDFVARIGGEEFVVVLTDQDHDAGVALAERLRRAVADQPWNDIPVPDGRVTVSVGVASAVLDTPQAVQELMRRADQALYAAKAAGRNRVDDGTAEIPAQPGAATLSAR